MQPPIDQGIAWTLPHFHDLRFMRAVYVQHAFMPHVHDYYVLGIIEKGAQSFTHGRHLRVTTPGRLIVINPDEVHTGEALVAGGFQYRALYPTVEMMRQLNAEFNADGDDLPRFGGGVKHDPQLFQWIQRLHIQSEYAPPALEIEAGLTAFFVTLIRRHATGERALPRYDSAPQAIARVRDYLEAHYAENVTLAALSQQANLSPYHLARLFQRHTGLAPHKYLESVRIRHAARLLAAAMPIADVAYSTGFSSQSHLNRTFKRLMGTTPGSFAQQRKIV